MKKQYITPHTVVREVEIQQVIAESVNSVLGIIDDDDEGTDCQAASSARKKWTYGWGKDD